MFSYGNVQQQGTNTNKVGKLLDMVASRGSSAFNGFIEALKETSHKDAAETLIQALNKL